VDPNPDLTPAPQAAEGAQGLGLPGAATSPGGPHSTGADWVDLDASERMRLGKRDPAALELFYARYFDRIYGYVRRLLREEHLAEDVTQDIFMHVWRSLPSYDPSRELRPWVFTIATNKVRDWWRSRRHADAQREVPAEDDERGPRAADHARGPVENLAARDLSEQVAIAIEELPEIARTTLVLRYYEGLSFEEIGRMVNRNETAVRKRYSRALDELRTRLADVWNRDGVS
jgi:RNA polymerase sigma-70 factor (ECF subfamily)